MADNGNPFDAPLKSGAQTATPLDTGIVNPFDAPLAASPDQTGQVTNDVGNTVIVPKGLGTGDEESFSDTIKRATQRSQSLTPQQRQAEIDKETATIPAKTAQTLGAAAGIGVAGPAALGGLGELIVNSPEIAKATIKHLMEPGTIFKFPAGRAVEYYLAGKLGLSKNHIGEIAKMVP